LMFAAERCGVLLGAAAHVDLCDLRGCGSAGVVRAADGEGRAPSYAAAPPWCAITTSASGPALRAVQRGTAGRACEVAGLMRRDPIRRRGAGRGIADASDLVCVSQNCAARKRRAFRSRERRRHYRALIFPVPVTLVVTRVGWPL
jgi:hypothetical protein